MYEENTSSDNNDEDGESSYLTIFNHNFFKSRNRNHNFSKVGTGTVKNSYGSTTLIPSQENILFTLPQLKVYVKVQIYMIFLPSIQT